MWLITQHYLVAGVEDLPVPLSRSERCGFNSQAVWCHKWVPSRFPVWCHKWVPSRFPVWCHKWVPSRFPVWCHKWVPSRFPVWCRKWVPSRFPVWCHKWVPSRFPVWCHKWVPSRFPVWCHKWVPFALPSLMLYGRFELNKLFDRTKLFCHAVLTAQCIWLWLREHHITYTGTMCWSVVVIVNQGAAANFTIAVIF